MSDWNGYTGLGLYPFKTGDSGEDSANDAT